MNKQNFLRLATSCLTLASLSLGLLGNAHAAGNVFTDIVPDTITPRYGEPVTLSFPGVTDAQCTISVSSNVFGFQLQSGTPVINGKLVFVPQSSLGPIDEGFTMTIGGSNYNGGCSGQPKTINIQVNAGRINSVAAETNTTPQGKPVNVMVYGIPGRMCDGAAVDFGDGTPAQQVSGYFPIKTSHVYAQPGAYKQSVKATGATCYNSAVSEYATNVLDAAAMSKITTMQVEYGNTQKTAAKITINGNAGGACEKAMVNWGDGTSPEPLSGAFPLHGNHAFASSGTQNIKVVAADGFKCTGQSQATIFTYPAQAKFTAVTPGNSSTAINKDVLLELTGSGICQNVSVDVGDNLNIISLGAVMFNAANNYKVPFKVKYAKAGNYTVYVKDTGASACGILTPTVAVGGPQLTIPVMMPPVVPRPVSVSVGQIAGSGAAIPAAPVGAPAGPATPAPKGPVARPCAAKGKPQLNDGCSN